MTNKTALDALRDLKGWTSERVNNKTAAVETFVTLPLEEYQSLLQQNAELREDKDILHGMAAKYLQGKETAERERDELRAALVELVAKLDAIQADESFRGIWSYLYAHNYTYSGPSWHDELRIARDAIAKQGERK